MFDHCPENDWEDEPFCDVCWSDWDDTEDKCKNPECPTHK